MSKPLTLAAIVLLLGAVACIRPGGPQALRHDLARSAGVKLDREFGLTVTRSGMWLARKALRASGEELSTLRGVRRVEIGIYRVRGVRRGASRGLDAGLFGDDWSKLVQVRGSGDDALVLIRERQGAVRELVVVAADHEEWAIVRIGGDLHLVLEEALRLAFDEAKRPGLYSQTRIERGLDP